MNAIARDTAKLIKEKQGQIDMLNHEIDQLAKRYIPDFHFIDHKVSTFWTCEKSPIGMCVWNRIEGRFSINCRCRFCGGPVERK